MCYSLRSDKAQATGVWHFLLRQVSKAKKANAKSHLIFLHYTLLPESKSGKAALPTPEKSNPESFFTALAQRCSFLTRVCHSLRSNKAQATGVRRSAFCLLEGLPPPNPRIIFLKNKSRTNQRTNQSSYPSKKRQPDNRLSQNIPS